jgi:hypothetical protein
MYSLTALSQSTSVSSVTTPVPSFPSLASSSVPPSKREALLEVLRAPELCSRFHLFLQEVYAAKNLAFLLEFEHFRALSPSSTSASSFYPNSDRLRQAKKIFEEYLADEGPNVLPVEGTLKKHIKQQLETGNFDEKLFDLIALEVLQILETDLLPKFLHSYHSRQTQTSSSSSYISSTTAPSSPISSFFSFITARRGRWSNREKRRSWTSTSYQSTMSPSPSPTSYNFLSKSSETPEAFSPFLTAWEVLHNPLYVENGGKARSCSLSALSSSGLSTTLLPPSSPVSSTKSTEEKKREKDEGRERREKNSAKQREKEGGRRRQSSEELTEKRELIALALLDLLQDPGFDLAYLLCEATLTLSATTTGGTVTSGGNRSSMTFASNIFSMLFNSNSNNTCTDNPSESSSNSNSHPSEDLTDGDVIESILDLAESCCFVEDLIRERLKKELQSLMSQQETVWQTLFREDSVFTKLISKYFIMKGKSFFFNNTLSPFVVITSELRSSLEIDQNRDPELTQGDAEKNADRLVRLAADILNRLFAAISHAPP